MRGILSGMVPDDDLRDEALTAALRTALDAERAPEAWRSEALRVPRNAVRALPEEDEPLISALLPHACGLIVLVGVVASFFVFPAIQVAFGEFAARLAGDADAAAATPPSPYVLGLLGLAFFVGLVLEGSAGFRHVKQWVR